MTLLRTHAHEGTNGATATVAGEGYNADLGTGTAPTYTNAAALVGSTSIQFPGTVAGYQFQDNLAAPWTHILFYIPAIPAATITFSRKRTSGGTTLAQLQINTSRKLIAHDGTAAVATSTTTLATGTWYQAIWGVPGNATQTLLLYNSTGTLLETVANALGAVAGTVGQVMIGQNTASGSAIYLDRHELHDTQPSALTPGSPGTLGDTLTYSMNRLAGTLVNGVPKLSITGAANVYAGTTNQSLVGALNIKAGNTLPNYKALAGVLNQLAGTTNLSPTEAASRIIA